MYIRRQVLCSVDYHVYFLYFHHLKRSTRRWSLRREVTPQVDLSISVYITRPLLQCAYDPALLQCAYDSAFLHCCSVHMTRPCSLQCAYATRLCSLQCAYVTRLCSLQLAYDSTHTHCSLRTLIAVCVYDSAFSVKCAYDAASLQIAYDSAFSV